MGKSSSSFYHPTERCVDDKEHEQRKERKNYYKIFDFQPSQTKNDKTIYVDIMPIHLTIDQSILLNLGNALEMTFVTLEGQ